MHCHRAEAAEAEVKRLTAELAERDQRIAAVERLLERADQDTRDYYGGQPVDATIVTAYIWQALRGES